MKELIVSLWPQGVRDTNQAEEQDHNQQEQKHPPNVIPFYVPQHHKRAPIDDLDV
jgi:hypothetical protein